MRLVEMLLKGPVYQKKIFTLLKTIEKALQDGGQELIITLPFLLITSAKQTTIILA